MNAMQQECSARAAGHHAAPGDEIPRTMGLANDSKPQPPPPFEPLPDRLEGPVLLKLGKDIPSKAILPPAAEGSDIPELSRFVFHEVDPTYYDLAMKFQTPGHCVVAGENYGQGSSHENAAIALRYLGLRMVLAKSFGDAHREHLIHFGILPLQFIASADWEKIDQNDVLAIESVHDALLEDSCIILGNKTKKQMYETRHGLTRRQIDILFAGSLIEFMSARSKLSVKGHT
jgi:aconitate hydratase